MLPRKSPCYYLRVTSPQSPHEKGNILQDAVLSIERHILHTAPQLRNKNFTIEAKKIINSEGVHHEIDIYVAVDSAPGYAAVYIFECKNWKDAVGKNEIIAFIEKISCSNAAHGYFVATTFSKDAMAQAEKCTRLTLFTASENDPVGLAIPGEFHTTVNIMKRMEVELRQRGSKPDAKFDLFDVNTVKAELNGIPFSFPVAMRTFAEELAARDTLTFPSHRFPIGDYDRETVGTRVFPNGELQVNDKDIELLILRVNYTVSIYRPAIKWSFDIEKRGRVMSFEPVIMPDGSEFVSRIIESNPK
jgi:hypothetical protein